MFGQFTRGNGQYTRGGDGQYVKGRIDSMQEGAAGTLIKGVYKGVWIEGTDSA